MRKTIKLVSKDPYDVREKLIPFLENELNYKIVESETEDLIILHMIQQASQTESTKKNLSTRENEILKLIAQGHQNKSIAHQLYLSEKTVKNHITEIYKKLDVSNRTHAVLYALRNQLI